MGALALNRHAFLAALVCALAVLAGCLGAGAGAVSGSAVSATPRSEIEEPAVPGDQLFPLGGPALTVAREIAERHWGGAACAGGVDIGWAALEEGTNATASWRNPTDAWNNADANFDCRIDFNTGAQFDWPKLCSVMAHEVGHLRGRQHAEDPDDLMAPLYTRPLQACEQTPDPGGAPAPAADAPAAEPETIVESVTTPARPRRSAAEIRAAVKRRVVAEQRAKRCRAARRSLRVRGLSGRRARLARAKQLRCSLPRAGRSRLVRR